MSVETHNTYAGRLGRFDPEDLDAERPLWFRQDKESPEAYEAFMVYLTLPMGDRSARRAGQIVGKSLSLMQKWMHRWSWTMRVGAYEEHYLLLRLGDIESKRDEMYVRQEQIASTGLNIVELEFQRFLARLNDENGSDIKPDALMRLFDIAAKIQRLAVNGRVKAAEEMQAKSERLAEEQSDELVLFLREVMNTLDLSPAQQELLNETLKKQLVGQEA